MGVKLMRSDRENGEGIPTDITIGIMNIYEEIFTFNL